MTESLKQRFFNRRWALGQCRNGLLPEEICRYIHTFDSSPALSRSLDDITFVVFDTETTGLNPQKDDLLSIGAVKVKGRNIHVGDAFESLVRYEKDANRESVVVHGILPSQSLAGREEKEVIVSLLDYMKNSVLVAHHAIFDISMVNTALTRYFGIKLYNQYLDTILLSMRLERFNQSQDQMEQKRYSLDSLCDRYGIPAEERHTAVGDAFITGQLLVKLIEKAKGRGISTLGQLLK